MTDMRDDLIERVVYELRVLPDVDEVAVGRILRAARADAIRGPRAAVGGQSWWLTRVPIAAAAGIAVAAGIAGFLARGLTRNDAAPPVRAVMPIEGTASLASAPRVPRPASRAVQFILAAPGAARVALVGDFNGWDADATPLARDPSSGIWTATVALAPGRHVYAFLVNGAVLTLDPRAPSARDADFGTPSSVVLVGAP